MGSTFSSLNMGLSPQAQLHPPPWLHESHDGGLEKAVCPRPYPRRQRHALQQTRERQQRERADRCPMEY